VSLGDGFMFVLQQMWLFVTIRQKSESGLLCGRQKSTNNT